MLAEKMNIFVRHIYKKRAKRYDLTAQLYYLFGFREWAYRKRAVEKLKLKDGDTVVEIGCGTGLNFALIQKIIGENGKIIGVDITKEMLKEAEKRVKEKYTLKDGTWNSLQTIRERNRNLPKGQKKGFGYSIVDREGPSRTLTKRYFKDGAEILIEQKNKNPRRLTPLEALRLMGFDQIEGRYNNTDEIFVISDSQAFRQLGNAVVPHVVEAVGREVLRTIENN